MQAFRRMLRPHDEAAPVVERKNPDVPGAAHEPPTPALEPALREARSVRGRREQMPLAVIQGEIHLQAPMQLVDRSLLLRHGGRGRREQELTDLRRGTHTQCRTLPLVGEPPEEAAREQEDGEGGQDREIELDVQSAHERAATGRGPVPWRRRTRRRAPSGSVAASSGHPRSPRGSGRCARRSNDRTPRERCPG